MNFQLLIFLANLILMLVFFLLIVKHVKAGFKKIGRNTLILLFLIFLIGLALRIPLTPYHIMTDEYYYMEVAKNILKTGEPDLCAYINIDTESCRLYMKPPLFPFILSLVFIFFGVNSLAAISVSVAAGSLSIILIFLLAYLLFRKREVGLWSAFLFALNPIHITWSKTAETNVTSLFLTLLVFVLFLFYFRVRDKKILFLGLFTTMFAVNLRPENGVLIILVFLLFYLFDCDPLKLVIKNLKNKEFWVWGAVLMVILIPNLIFVSDNLFKPSLYVCQENGCYNQIFSLEAAKNNWEMYGLLSFFSHNFHPLILGSLALLSFLFIRGYKKELTFLWAYFLSFYLMFITYNFAGARLLIPLYLAIAVLAGFSLFRLRGCLEKYLKFFAVLFLLILTAVSFYPHILETTWTNPMLASETMLPEMVEKDVRSECYVLAEMPSILNSKTDIKTIPTEYALDNPQTMENIIKDSDCTFFLEDTFYIAEGIFYNIENFDKINQTYKLTPYKEYSLYNIKFHLYNLALK
ncbi:MAG: glycosyltransferase family 39 protein [Candidatus Aenigmatarchaeota archaeon]|nr:MAG: glycosyltransferase family 39 protein [Candidatus Aenigmarchaeota archaeon]